jgi:hypothetical protein
MTLPNVTIAVGLRQKAFGLLQSHAITGRPAAIQLIRSAMSRES